MNAGAKFDASCTNTATCNCVSITNSLNNGIDEIHESKHVVSCIGNTISSSCQLGDIKYQCSSGYYGTATSALNNNNCIKCPTNATCDGGNNSTFKCSQGYYKNNNTCTQCPTPGTTISTGGATDITKCYIPAGNTFTDEKGTGIYHEDCYY